MYGGVCVAVRLDQGLGMETEAGSGSGDGDGDEDRGWVRVWGRRRRLGQGLGRRQRLGRVWGGRWSFDITLEIPMRYEWSV